MNADQPRTEAERRPGAPTAGTRRSWWPGWIWAIPVAAVGIVIWLGIRSFANSGVEARVVFDTAAGMKASGGTPVTYRELEVGKVTALSISKDGGHVIAKLDIDDQYEKFLTTGTRFWLKGAEVSFSDLASLKSIVSGPTIVMSPGRGAPLRDFTGLDKAPPLPDWGGAPVLYRVLFTGDVGGLERGAPVKLRGFVVGEVTGVGLDWDAKAGQLSAPVTIALDPTRIHVVHPGTPAGGIGPAALNAILQQLIRQGLRARLDQNPPLVGKPIVALDFQPGAGPAELATGGRYPQIPAEDSGGIGGLVAKASAFPIAAIGDNIRAITDQVKGIVSSPELKASIDHLDATLAILERTIRKTGPRIPPLVDTLRQAADQLQSTAKAADTIAGGGASETGNLKTAIHELTETARSIRTLANYLDEHPEAMIRGR